MSEVSSQISILRSARACTAPLLPALRAQDIVRVPHDVKNARQILDKDYMMYNTCHGSPDAALGTPSSKTNTDPVIKPHEGSTSYLKLSGVQVDPTAPPINLIVKNTSTYIPAWPRLGDCYKFVKGKGRDKKSPNLCDKGADFARNHATGDVLKPAGYLNNGRKTGAIQANDLLQVNLCSNRFLNLKASLVDDDDKDVTLMQSTFRFFDIDHGNSEKQGPEVMQFDCTGGTFTLYGEESDEDKDIPNLEFLMHISDDAKAGHRPDDYGVTPNGLGIHVYDCPANKLVTLWSSRFGVGKDNPTSSVIPAGGYGKEQERSLNLTQPLTLMAGRSPSPPPPTPTHHPHTPHPTHHTHPPPSTLHPPPSPWQERSMVQIDMYNINEFEVSFAVLDQDYQDGWAPVKDCGDDGTCMACVKGCKALKKNQQSACKKKCEKAIPGNFLVDQAKLARLQQGKKLNGVNYPEMVRHQFVS